MTPYLRKPSKTTFTMMRCAILCICAASIAMTLWVQPSAAQDGPQPINAADIQDLVQQDPVDEASAPPPSGIDLLTLIARGGSFMIPIGLMSFLVVALAAERMISLRLNKVMPKGLVDELEECADPIDRFNPSRAYQACLNYPSSASRVITSMLMRTGQPLGEIERTANESIQREADQQSSAIRWLTLAAAATPLMGLLGTVWGMIVAFHEATSLTPDRSRSEQLSEGIYTALVTTLAGLVVAIPAAILALYLENRLSKLFHHVEQLAFDIAPGLDRFTGRRRLDAEGTMHSIESAAASKAPPPVNSGAPQPPPPPPVPSNKSRGGAKAG